ncbi:MgtC/SapB family protein [archaeon]|jgi:putative Mg2+ transporter-C (MgtC) family protein|nr:MgtC/SapB family protein [archaeon]MBT6761961.1 MgtC/SapB family protein [archaeon]
MVVGTEVEVLRQVTIAMLLGFAVGIEREIRGKPAGMRTYTLLTGAACMFTILGFMVVETFGRNYSHLIFNADPTRIIHAIIVGISFLGAGLIITGKDNKVQNLTTAAGVLIMATVGIAVGLNHIFLALGITALVVFINSGILFVEQKILGTHIGKKKTKKKAKNKILFG